MGFQKSGMFEEISSGNFQGGNQSASRGVRAVYDSDTNVRFNVRTRHEEEAGAHEKKESGRW